MSLIPIQLSDLKIGQPLSWSLFDKDREPIMERGYIIKTTDELEELSKRSSGLFKLKDPSKRFDSIDKRISDFNFGDMQLKVGDKLYLQLHSSEKNLYSSNNRNNCMSTIIGYVPNQYLIVSMPKTNQLIGQPFLEGDQIMVRLFSGQCVFSFTVFVDKIVNLSFKYIHLTFPKNIAGQVIRNSRRVKTAIEAKASINNESTPIIITNLSAAGAEITTHSELGKSDARIGLLVKVKIHEKEILLQLQAIIKSLKSKNREGLACYGVEFTGLQADQIFSLRSFIYQELIEKPDSSI